MNHERPTYMISDLTGSAFLEVGVSLASPALGTDTTKAVWKSPGNEHDYEKSSPRTCTDDEGHEKEPPMTINRFMSLLSMTFLWTGSQIPLYLFGAISTYIYGDIGGYDRFIWSFTANLIALTVVCPFVGALSDLLGRRYVALTGAGFIVLGMIVCSTAKHMNAFIGIGAGINELTALAATSELAPTSKRGTYNAVLVSTIIPFGPSVLYAQLIAYHSNWRYVGLFCALWAFIGMVMAAIFYFPPPRPNSSGLTRKETTAQIEFVGGFLSVTGVLLFLAGLIWGGYQYPWSSIHVLIPLIFGLTLITSFIFWEIYGATHPMFPSRLKKDPRILILTLIITFISGAQLFSVAVFWPSQALNLYGHDPIGVGLRGLPVAFSILVGACIVLYLLSVFKGGNRALLVLSSCMMTAGSGAMAALDRENLHMAYGILVIAGLGIGGIVVPASIITTIIYPDDLIATITALTLAIRVIGGTIGYAVYFNVFQHKFGQHLGVGIAAACVENGIFDPSSIKEIAELTAYSLTERILHVPGVDENVTIYNSLVIAGQEAYALSYPWVYYASIPFGVVCIIASLFLGDISKYMDDHVAVVIK